MGEVIIPRRDRQRPAFAEFLSGPDFKAAVEAFVDASALHSFGRAREWNASAQKIVVSSQDSASMIYAWQDGETLYWYSESSVAYLNEDSATMFQDFPYTYESGGSTLRNDVFSFGFEGISAARAVDMSEFFRGSNINSVPFPQGWDMRRATTIENMFRGCYTLGAAGLHLNVRTSSSLSSADSLFMDCRSLRSAKISCDLSGLTSLRNWFRGDSGLRSFDFTDADLSAVTNMPSMLEGCLALTSVDMQEAGLSGVRPQGDSMFRSCTSLKRVKFQEYTATASLAFGSDMFRNCAALTEADFSRIAVSGSGSLKASDRMFSGCSALSVVYTSDDWAGGSARDVFTECPIVGGAGTAFDPEHTDGEYARIDNRPTQPGYFTYKART